MLNEATHAATVGWAEPAIPIKATDHVQVMAPYSLGIAALNANDWKRQQTAAHLGISRKVLWEKMRKYQISDGEPEVPMGAAANPVDTAE